MYCKIAYNIAKEVKNCMSDAKGTEVAQIEPGITPVQEASVQIGPEVLPDFDGSVEIDLPCVTVSANIEEIEGEELEEIDCPRCMQRGVADHRNKHICRSCAKAENNLYSHRRRNHDWVAVAQEIGLELWMQQPEETQWEYTVWLAYRDSYPGKKPSYRAVAEQLSTTVNAVMKTAQRWSFQTRMQAWMRHCDDITLLQRRTEILDMNKAHISMATKLRDKLGVAIDNLEPVLLGPKEIVSLAKLSAELERKARLDTLTQEEQVRVLTTDNDNPALKTDSTPASDINEVLQILTKTGALGKITNIGVRETKTTEIALVDNDGNSTAIQLNKGAP